MKIIQNKLHKIGTYEVCKHFLFCFDDKRYILDDGINSLGIKSQLKCKLCYKSIIFMYSRLT